MLRRNLKIFGIAFATILCGGCKSRLITSDGKNVETQIQGSTSLDLVVILSGN